MGRRLLNLDRTGLARVRADDAIEACERDGGGSRPILDIEGAQALQPLVERGGQLGLQLGRLHREDRVLVHHVIDGRPCRLTHQQLVEDESGCVEVRSDARLGGILVALGCLVHRIELVDDLFRDGARAVPARARMVEATEQRAAGGADEHCVRRQVAMHDLRLATVRMIECGQDVAHNRDLLVEGECKCVLRDVLPQGVSGHVLGD